MNVRINKLPMAHFKGDLEKTTTQFIRILYVLAGLAIVSNLAFDYVLSIKAVLIFIVSIFVARETEILYVTQKNGVMRPEAKETLKTTHPEITALIFALLLPVGTPLFVVAAGSFVSVFIGKMVFGGYTFNVFNPAIVGRLFVSIAWPTLVTINFSESFDTYLLNVIFQKDLTTEVLSPLMELRANGIVSLENMSSLKDIILFPNYGMMFSIPAVVYLLLIIHFVVSKIVDLRPLLFTLITSLIGLSVITHGFDLPATYPLFHLLAGGFLFVTLFMMTDPFTKPYNNHGIFYYSTIFTVVYLLIRFLGKDPDGVLYALLFTNLFVPLLNKKTEKLTSGFNVKNFVSVIAVILTLVGTGIFVTTVLESRIADGEIVVGSYGKN